MKYLNTFRSSIWSRAGVNKDSYVPETSQSFKFPTNFMRTNNHFLEIFRSK